MLLESAVLAVTEVSVTGLVVLLPSVMVDRTYWWLVMPGGRRLPDRSLYYWLLALLPQSMGEVLITGHC